MDYRDFQETVKNKIEDMLPDNYDVSVLEVAKNNGRKLASLVIRKEGDMIAPNIYLEELYEGYNNGRGVNEICGVIMDMYEAAMLQAQNLEMSFEDIKEQIFPQLVNKEMNEELLKNVPNRDFLDMSIVYRIKIGREATILINNSLFERMGEDEETLYNTSVKNLESDEDMKPCIKTMEPMHVLSNRCCMMGANAVLDQKFMDEVEDLIGSVNLIPSSVHEFIAISKNEIDVQALQDMVRNANGTVVEPKEVLSYKVYVYENGAMDLARNYNYEVVINKGLESEKRHSAINPQDAVKLIKEKGNTPVLLNVKTASGECTIYDSNFGLTANADADMELIKGLLPEIGESGTLEYDLKKFEKLINEKHPEKTIVKERDKCAGIEI